MLSPETMPPTESLRTKILLEKTQQQQPYGSKESQKGLTFTVDAVAGRTMVTPNSIVERFSKELESEPQMEFIYFIRGSENRKNAQTATVEEFQQSTTWSKFSFLHD